MSLDPTSESQADWTVSWKTTSNVSGAPLTVASRQPVI
jgi:hypothetical protein